MDTMIVKRGLAILSIIVVVIVASVACNMIARDEDDPTVSDPDGIFMTFNGIEITNQMLYDRMKAADGLQQLINFIDQRLLSEYMDDVTGADIEAEILRQMYGTDDQDEIDRYTEAEKEEKEQDFRDGVIFAGFDPDDQDAVDAYMRLLLAQDAYTADVFRTTDHTSEFFLTDGDLNNFYEDYMQGDLHVIPLRFYNNAERDTVFNHFNIVRNYDGGYGLYHGEKDIEEMSRDEFDEDNTDLLEDDEVLRYFIKMYNYINQRYEPIDPDATIEDIIALEREDLLMNQFELQELAAERQTDDFSPYTDMSDYLWGSLRESSRPYTVTVRAIADERLYFYALEYEEVTSFDDLSDQEIDELREMLIETMVDDQMVELTMKKLHEENNIAIFDTKLAYAYDMQFGRNVHASRDEDNHLASYDDNIITVDEYFEHMVKNVGSLHALEVAKTEYLFQSIYFDDIYGGRRDVWNNRSDLMAMHREDLREEKNLFSNGAYQMFGINPEHMTWNEYLFLFGRGHQVRQYFQQMYGYHPLQFYGFDQGDSFHSEEDILKRMVEHTLRYDFVLDVADFDMMHELVELYYENYFSLIVQNAFFYLDNDLDFFIDDMEAYYDELPEEEQDQFNTLRAQLHALIQSELDDGETLKDIINQYRRAPYNEDEEASDYSKWAVFKNYGFRVRHEDLSNDGVESLNFHNTRNEEEAFRQALIDIYSIYQDEANEDEDYMTSESLVRTQFSMLFIKAEQGARFEQPSAQFDNEDGEYDSLMENDAHIPSIDQMKLYMERLVVQYRDGSTDIEFPDDVQRAIRIYFEPTLNRMISEFYYTMVMIETMENSDWSFTNNEEVHKNRLNSLYDIYLRRMFPELQD